MSDIAMSRAEESLAASELGASPLDDPPINDGTGVDSALLCLGDGQPVRWRSGERLEQLFEDRCDQLRVSGHRGQLAVDTPEIGLTFDDLDARANQLARRLLARGVRPGDRVGLLFDQALPSYVGLLAVLKIHAAYVPLDASYPPDRLSYILKDAGVWIVLTLQHLRNRLDDVAVTFVSLDEEEPLTAAKDGCRLTLAETGDPVNELCYIIYTSGTTGHPKGVAIEHASICNFVRVAAEVYGVQMTDRVYQGMTIAFDFSVEEIWVPWMVGATLVPKPAGTTLLGAELREFLVERRVTGLCCVPTLLSTIDQDVPGLRFLLVSGESCPQDLVARWHRAGRRFLNVYGPTEATVTATWSVVHPDRPVDLGVPLPTYSAVILDPAGPRALPRGEVGEIGLAGLGLARGYVNRDDLTDRAFIDDFIGIVGNPSERIYRTGDLGRINDGGTIEYQGRIDTQVKVRGFRIELTEIESVMLQVPGIAQAVVDTYEPLPGQVELVAYYTLRKDTPMLDQQRIVEHLRGRLPGYMVPAYLEHLDAIPMLPSDKADRKNLPAPTGRLQATEHSYVAPTTSTEKALTDALADALQLEKVSVDSHFFDDLGANSLLMARFCTAVRKHPEMPRVSMRDIYLNPTARSLAAHLDETASAAEGLSEWAPAQAVPPTKVSRPGTVPYVLCGAAQLLLFLGATYLVALAIAKPLGWVMAGTGLAELYLRSVVYSAGLLAVTTILPIIAKWVLIGRGTPRQIPVWSLQYLRFWIVKLLIRASPFARFSGSPLYVLYLRALGAKIGKGVVILSPSVPVCPDLLTIGSGTIIRKTSFFTGYRAHAGFVETGPVTLGKDVYIGEATVLDINTRMGDQSQLGHSSSLHAGQSVPDGQHWHGSPAQPTTSDYQVVPPARCGTLRRFVYGATQLLIALLITGPVGLALLATLLGRLPWATQLVDDDHNDLTQWSFYLETAMISFVLFCSGILLGLILITALARLSALVLRPGKVYRLYGFHYWVQRLIGRRTNSRFLTFLFGDSSYIVHYLRALGYHLTPLEQTGSNFGMAVQHESPDLSSVGTGTMVSDGLSFLNADFSSTSFTVSRVSVGARNFMGNLITYPAQAKTGDNCLLATKVMIPIDGEVRENVGLLGSPPFEIPRSVQRDSAFDELKSGDDLRRNLSAKNRHNRTTMGLYLFVRWIYFYAVLLIAAAAVRLYYLYGEFAVQTLLIAELLFTVGYFAFVERASTRFRAQRPRFCSIYQPDFWRHERFWKVPAMTYHAIFNGTPFKAMIWRILGVRVGRRLFDDGSWMTERTLVRVGDDCTLNAGTIIQSHSLEDGTFKSDFITIGDRCTTGINAFVHYSVTIGDGAVLAPDSFLMKGEDVPANSSWGGNPARELTEPAQVSALGGHSTPILASARRRRGAHRPRETTLPANSPDQRRSPSSSTG